MTMTDMLHSAAQNDTPQEVDVPKSPYGLIIWAVGKFGGGALMAAAAIYGLNVVYTDLKTTHEKLLTVIEKRAEVDVQMNRTLADLAVALKGLYDDAKEAHKRIVKIP